MLDPRNDTAGGKPPAVRASGQGVFAHTPDWAGRSDPPAYHVHLWPNRSLGRRGRRGVMTLLGVGLLIPLIPSLGTPVFWGLLPFEAAAFFALWYSFRRNDADARLTEELALWPDEIRVERCEPSGQVLRWRADPYWVRITVHSDSRPEKYLTLKGGGREIELGAFLSPGEREALAEEIESAIRATLTRGAVPPDEPAGSQGTPQ
ncbi:DUF2244 domain-containing protein [Limibaculum sp. M0105]|uniref:DUF2244 domain-containing protein n=1 Tax=Thermohalobaculum xanthum TaxID=2753746 RepID=A0A8J7M595_9RHOB|nr:DUF2244 domain-containing protein [Thermohalobaculum xanthum]MBK0398440.1 DUF2244 domain-containing protein [Thermohalobaculum xanthum]